MARLNIPHKTLVAIADRLVEQPKTAKRSNRCPSKVTILRRLMEADSALYGRVVQMSKEVAADVAKADAAAQGFTIRNEREVETASSQPCALCEKPVALGCQLLCQLHDGQRIWYGTHAETEKDALDRLKGKSQ